MGIDRKAYIYAILVDGVVRYVGKGRGRRVLFHLQMARNLNRRRLRGELVKAGLFHNRLAKALRNGSLITTRILKDGLSDAVAFAEESKQIARRKNLWNVNLGGRSGFESEFAKMLADNRWSDPAQREEQSRRSKVLIKQMWEDDQYQEYRDRQLIHLREMNGKCHTPEQLQKAADTLSLYNKSELGRKRLSQRNKERWANPEYKARVRAALSVAQKKAWAAGGARRVGTGE